MRWSAPEREEELLEPLAANEQAWDLGRGYTFTLERLRSDERLGRIAIRRHDKDVWDLGFWTHPLHQGQGYMTEAAVALVAFGFRQLGASSIQAAHATWNGASRRVLEKAGLRFLRHVPEGFQKNGVWVAEDVLLITREEWGEII